MRLLILKSIIFFTANSSFRGGKKKFITNFEPRFEQLFPFFFFNIDATSLDFNAAKNTEHAGLISLRCM